MRCFIAIDIPEEVEKKIRDVQKEIDADNGVKITNDFHITLKFLGEVDEKDVKNIIMYLEKIKESRFDIVIKNLGAFPNEKYIRVLWLGCYSSKLIELANIIRRELKDFGDNEDFTPHITIARIKNKPKNSIYNFISKFRNIEIGKFEVKDFKLKKSTLTPKGAVYNDLYVFELEKNDVK